MRLPWHCVRSSGRRPETFMGYSSVFTVQVVHDQWLRTDLTGSSPPQAELGFECVFHHV